MAKQASAMLDLVRSCRLVFTATITRMFIKMMRGQVRALTATRTINTARRSTEIFPGFIGKSEKPQLSAVVLSVVRFISVCSLCVLPIVSRVLLFLIYLFRV